MTALLSLTVDLVTSTFYRKREQPGTAEPVKQSEGISEEHCLPGSNSVVKELTVLNYREAVSFIWLRSASEGKRAVSLTTGRSPQERGLRTSPNLHTIVNDLNKLTSIMCHCERSEAISWDCHVHRIKCGVLAMTTFQSRSL